MNTDGIDITKSQSNAREHNLMLQGRSKFFFLPPERDGEREKKTEGGREWKRERE